MAKNVPLSIGLLSRMFVSFWNIVEKKAREMIITKSMKMPTPKNVPISESLSNMDRFSDTSIMKMA
jgi:hypothetical protein